LIGFDRTIKTVTGEDDPGLISQIKDRAIELYNDEGEGYQRAVWLYQTVDTAASALGTAAMANKVGQDISFLGFLQNLTPKPEKAQAIDLGMKIVVELLAYCQINGIPGDSIGDFLGSLADYGGESKMRMAAMVCLDGLVPLGPNFIKAAGDWIGSATQSSMEENEAFRNIQKMIPGTDKVAFVGQAFSSVSSWMGNFVSDHSLNPQIVLQHLQGFVDIADDKLDYVGAFLDMSTNYYYHTGVQTVAKRLIDRAYAEI
jgi:hypothetical protein